MLKSFLQKIKRSAPAPMRITLGVLEQIRRTVGSFPPEHGGVLGGSPDLINASKTVLIGPITAETAKELKVNIDIQAEEQSIAGIVEAITVHVGHVGEQ